MLGRLKLVTWLAKLHPSNTSRISLHASKHSIEIDIFKEKTNFWKKYALLYFYCNKGNDPEIGRGASKTIFCGILKISKFQKQIKVSSILPKIDRKITILRI